jgi:hypothetical protein
MIEVKKFPVKESLRSRVNFESLKGICSALLRVVSALITFPKHERE